MKTLQKSNKEKLLIRACHSCLKINESHAEMERCSHCNKAFLPLKYFEKIHESKSAKYKELFSATSELEEEDLIKGLFVLW